MKRMTYRESEAAIAEIEMLVDEGVYPNKAEFIREATRLRLKALDQSEFPDLPEKRQRVNDL